MRDCRHCKLVDLGRAAGRPVLCGDCLECVIKQMIGPGWKWTTIQPTKPGWYRAKFNNKPEVVQVDYNDDGFLVAWRTDDLCDYLFASFELWGSEPVDMTDPPKEML